MEHTIPGILGGWAVGAGCVYSSSSFEPFEVVYQKLLGEVDAEFVRNLKVLVDFEGSNMNDKKSLVDADASPSIQASIHRSLVSPTALGVTVLRPEVAWTVLYKVIHWQ